MTDLEKFKQLFDDIGIGYKEEKHSSHTDLAVDKSALFDGYAVGLDVSFSTEGKFDKFVTSGE